MFHVAVAMAAGLMPLYAVPTGAADRAASRATNMTSDKPVFISKARHVICAVTVT